MCHITTPYHPLCGHYGPRAFFNEVVRDVPGAQGMCIRARTQPGWSRGCADVVDMGVENLRGRCARCEGGNVMGEQVSGAVEVSVGEVGWVGRCLRKVDSAVALAEVGQEEEARGRRTRLDPESSSGLKGPLRALARRRSSASAFPAAPSVVVAPPRLCCGTLGRSG
ncbi:hypothetical protein Tdes44962_MAKER09309 [Teratosphaeria destructans]|uniref:Uncharacterized protein n=1 Tax=Teratosphaeria destructans TaxID=418781 RepID=A0A9W7W369_9PEZI|nr:hypothetical protein Tdes44962_MAKER09309 [Teratosphaeria destructans]